MCFVTANADKKPPERYKRNSKYGVLRHVSIQLKSDETAQLLNEPYVNEVISRGQNLFLKCCQSFKILPYIEKEFRSFNTSNMGSVGQRTAKLTSVKL